MSVLRKKATLARQMNEAWTELTSSVRKLASGCDIRPRPAAEAIVVERDDDQTMKVVINPVACLLREKASSEGRIFVTVKGKVNFSIDSDDLLACHFSTQAAWFRERNSRELDHILGVHYDYDDTKPAHPVFHAQLKSFQADHASINRLFNESFTIACDRMEHCPGHVRIPTAHMDPLSVFMQLVADHLLNENSGADAQRVYDALREKMMFFRSDPRRSQRLDAAIETRCMRGPRWYPLPAQRGAAFTGP